MMTRGSPIYGPPICLFPDPPRSSVKPGRRIVAAKVPPVAWRRLRPGSAVPTQDAQGAAQRRWLPVGSRCQQDMAGNSQNRR